MAAGVDDMAVAGAIVMVGFMACWPSQRTGCPGRTDAPAWTAAPVAVAIPFAGFTLRYEASGWPAGLMAFSWVVCFWWAMAHAQRKDGSPLWAFGAGFMAITTGTPTPRSGCSPLLPASPARRSWARPAGGSPSCTAGVGAGDGRSAGIPAIAGGDPVQQQAVAGGYRQRHVHGAWDRRSVASSAVSYVPAITNWGGAVRESKPVVYLAWFLIPLLPWIRWRAAGQRLWDRCGLVFTGGLFLLMVLGPSNLWLFRWPLRLIEYLYLAVAVAFAVALGTGPARSQLSLRAALSAGIVLLGGYLSWAVWPRCR